MAWRKLQTPGVLRAGSAPVSTTIVAACPQPHAAASTNADENAALYGDGNGLRIAYSSTPTTGLDFRADVIYAENRVSAARYAP